MVQKLSTGFKAYIPFIIGQTDLLAGTSFEIVAPFDGYIEELQTIVQVAVTTGGPITVEINTVAVAGLSVTIPDAAAKGSRVSDTPTTPSPTRQFLKGDRIEIQPDAAFATAGAVSGNLLVRKSKTQSA